ncbi:MAG TPA: hypothetical protein VEH28_05750 [Thermoplasmata archaeon]|nr:hypothetical protein [Thermoplasmata archaeon]
MVVASLTIGAVVGVLLSAAFLYFEVGRYAEPQVPVTLFDERKELFAYTAGLFVGVPLAIAFTLFQVSMSAGALISAIICLGLLVIGDEVAQWALLRTKFWGREAARPFYVLSYRAAIGGIISLAIVSQYLSNPTVTVDGTVLVLLESVAVVALQVAGSFLSLPSTAPGERVGGSPVAGGLFSTVGFFLLGIGFVGGEATGYVGAIVALLGAVMVYRRLRPTLAHVPAPAAGPKPAVPEGPLPYGRTSRSEPLPPEKPPRRDD